MSWEERGSVQCGGGKNVGMGYFLSHYNFQEPDFGFWHTQIQAWPFLAVSF